MRVCPTGLSLQALIFSLMTSTDSRNDVMKYIWVGSVGVGVWSRFSSAFLCSQKIVVIDWFVVNEVLRCVNCTLRGSSFILPKVYWRPMQCHSSLKNLQFSDVLLVELSPIELTTRVCL